MNDNRVFIDTNIFVYAKLEHEHTKIKRQVASQLLKSIN
jgi:predicted nucleic acid-binding protein